MINYNIICIYSKLLQAKQKQPRTIISFILSIYFVDKPFLYITAPAATDIVWPGDYAIER